MAQRHPFICFRAYGTAVHHLGLIPHYALRSLSVVHHHGMTVRLNPVFSLTVGFVNRNHQRGDLFAYDIAVINVIVRRLQRQ